MGRITYLSKAEWNPEKEGATPRDRFKEKLMRTPAPHSPVLPEEHSGLQDRRPKVPSQSYRHSNCVILGICEASRKVSTSCILCHCCLPQPQEPVRC
ncbi:hypothetical protein CapIbe_010220 [Capra ibex]